ncbi:hypothetical protein HDU98_004385, partial [Podochytrium sp. JEL0797]
TPDPDLSCLSHLSGQWIHSSLIPTFPESQQKFLDIQRHTILDYVWKPDHCLLRDFTMVQARSCFVEKYPVVHLWGDSNTRRAIKMLGRTDWCMDPRDECNCEDKWDEIAPGSKHAARLILSVDADIYSTDQAVNKTDISTFLFQSIGGMGWRHSGAWRDFMVRGVESPFNAYYKDPRHPQLVILN